MHISAKTDYGLRAVLELSIHFGEGCIHSGDIAAAQNIPESYLVQLLNQLRKAGLIRSTRGPRGGHQLVRRPDEVTVGEVTVVLEGPVDLAGKGEDRPPAAQAAVVFKEVWDDVENAIDAVLSATTFADLVRRANSTAITFKI